MRWLRGLVGASRGSSHALTLGSPVAEPEAFSCARTAGAARPALSAS